MKNEPLDFLGNPIEVGDTVVWSDAGGVSWAPRRLSKTLVTRLTEKQVLVSECAFGKQWRPFHCVAVVAKGGTGE